METTKQLVARLRKEANDRDYTSGDLILSGEPADLAAQLTPEAIALIENQLDFGTEED